MIYDQTISPEPADSLRTDCLIIGAGLAGATLGYLLRKAGRDVLLLEICDAQKKDKLCAGAMNNETMKLLTQIFGPDVEESLHPGRFSQLRTRIDDKEIRTDLQNMFLALPRKRLDDYVLCRCLETDGQLLCRVSVKAIDIAAGEAECYDLKTKQHLTIRFDTIVGADGAASATRRLLTGRMPEVAPSLEAEVPKVSDDILMSYRFGRVGYSWYIPRDEGATVGICSWNSTPAFCKESLQLFLKEIRLDVDPQIIRGAFLPTGSDILLRAGKNAFFVGDAAGLIHPTLGAGIHYAIVSAQRLAEALLEGEDYEDILRPCTDNITKLAEKTIRMQFIKNLSIYVKGTPAEPLC